MAPCFAFGSFGSITLASGFRVASPPPKPLPAPVCTSIACASGAAGGAAAAAAGGAAAGAEMEVAAPPRRAR
eukprot:scaffold138728_cov145-Phaeocystis_antarctica.AAC.1